MYTKATVKMTEKGHIVVPKDVRNRLGLKPSSKLLLIESDGNLILAKEERLADYEDYSWIHAASEEVLKKVWEDEEDSVWEKYRKY